MCKFFYQVLNAILKLYNVYVRQSTSFVFFDLEIIFINELAAPITPSILFIIKNLVDVSRKIAINERFYSFLKNYIDALNGTHFQIYVKKKATASWRNRRSYLSQNVLAVVDFEMRFVYVLAN